MLIALLSDIHANLPALRAVLRDIDDRRVDGVYHLGDLVGYAPWPNEVVDLVAERGIAGVCGNYDSTVAADYKHCGCRYEDPRQEELSHVSFDWTKAHCSSATRVKLGRLPFRLDLRIGGGHAGGRTVVLVHGTPTLNTVYWTEDRSDDFCRKMASLAGLKPGDVIAFGHTHLPWTRVVDEIHFVNTGSVGRPKDGDPRAGYTALSIDDVAVRVDHVRVDYDYAETAEAIVGAGLPPEFADHVLSGQSENAGSKAERRGRGQRRRTR